MVRVMLGNITMSNEIATSAQLLQLVAKFSQVLPLDANRALVQEVIENKNDPLWVGVRERFVVKAPATLKASIDTDLNPKLPFDRAKVESHVKGGKVTIEKRDNELWINDKKVIPYLVSRQEGGKRIKGHELREELTGKSVLNACVLDFLIEHKDFIPDSWKKDAAGNYSYIFFWGTIYRDSDRLCIRYLCRRDDAWCPLHFSSFWLDDEWSGYNPAALLAN